MIQKRLILIIIAIFFVAGEAFAATADMNAASAALSAYERMMSGSSSSQVPVVEVPQADVRRAPAWRSSLEEIQGVSSALLETNRKLSSEAAQLQQTRADLEARIDALRTKNAQTSEDMERLRAESTRQSQRLQEEAVSELTLLRNTLEDRTQQLRAQKEILTGLQARQNTVSNKLDLLRLSVAGLEVDKKAAEVDARLRDEAAFKVLRADVGAMQDRLAMGEEQIRLLKLKTDELARMEQPYAPQIKELAAGNMELKDRLSVIQASKASQQEKLQESSARKFKVESDRNVRVLHQLLAEHAVLDAALRENGIKLEELKADVPQDPQDDMDALAQQAERLERQNAAINHEVNNLRENVALLEYKVSTLGRYKDRNKARDK